MFEKAKVGNRVWCSVYGWGGIIDIDPGEHGENIYQLLVAFEGYGQKVFTLGGRIKDDHINPVLFWNAFDIPEKAFLPPTIVEVENVNSIIGGKNV